MTADPARPVMDLDSAAAALGVEPSRILEMVAEGLLHPVGQAGDDERDGAPGPTFDAVEVRAVHDLGG